MPVAWHCSSALQVLCGILAALLLLIVCSKKKELHYTLNILACIDAAVL